MLVKSALVARGTFVLCEYDASSGSDDLNEISRKVLGKIPKTGSTSSYVYAGHAFHYLLDNDKDIVYLCVAALSAGSEANLKFLKELRRKFEAHSSTGRNSAAELTRMLRDLLSQYNKDKGKTDIQKMEAELEDVTEQMHDNLRKVMERGERIESLLDKTANLKSESASFRKGASRHNQSLWWRDNKGRIAIICCALLMLIFMAWRRHEHSLAVATVAATVP
mmetsp:Transcript_63799/g.118540  ORF Transcript_63799/g.118540 Transcript_63799/m.118540 type:complete len:222 (-) Transcript_63799:7-672(-)